MKNLKPSWSPALSVSYQTKQIFLKLAILLCITGRLVAQTDSASAESKKVKAGRYELGMNLYAMAVNGGDFYSNYKYTVDNFVFNGLYLKIHSGKNALRFSVNYLQKIIGSGSTELIKDRNLISSKSVELCAGYQRLLRKSSRRVVPYLSVDMAYDLRRELRMSTVMAPSYNDYAGYLVGSFTSSSIFSLTPGIGLRIALGKGLVLNVESNAQFFYALERINGGRDRNKLVGIVMRPLQVSLGFRF